MKYIILLILALGISCGNKPGSDAATRQRTTQDSCSDLQVGDRCEIPAQEFEPAHYGYIDEILCEYDPVLVWFNDDQGIDTLVEADGLWCPPETE